MSMYTNKCEFNSSILGVYLSELYKYISFWPLSYLIQCFIKDYYLNIYFSRLIPQVAENAAARALAEAKPLAWRRPTPKACMQEGEAPRERRDTTQKRVGESIPDGWRPEASPPAVRRDAEVKV